MIKFCRKRSLWLPTWQTCLICMTSLGLVIWFLLANIHPFLSVTKPAPGAKVLVIEGWVPDHVLKAKLSNFVAGQPYDYVCTTGATLPRGSYLSEHKTFADLTAQSLVQMGVPQERIVIAASEAQVRDRTYHSAVAFKGARESSQFPVVRDATSIDVLTGGVHGRRTLIVFRKVLGDGIDVGIISPESSNYDPKKWFKSSEGVKLVLIESISLAYEWMGKKDR